MVVFSDYVDTPIGILEIQHDKEYILSVHITGTKNKERYLSCKISEIAKCQIKEYFSGKRKIFDLPLKLIGSQFQRKVWNELLKIPYGTTCSYKDIAERINMPKAFRAVGMANNRNPIMIIIPCHRVIGKSGKLVGYGCGLEIKEYLLSIEKNIIVEGKVI